MDPLVEKKHAYRALSRPAWVEVVELAEIQQGLVTRAQLFERGFGRGRVGRELAAGRLHPVHAGVYSVGHRLLTMKGRWMAAVLACGPEAMLSHRSGGALWGIA